MEKSLQHRYLNSQDQLIINLNEQIEAMIPLKDSYASLQRYHIRLLHDFESLLAEQVFINLFRIIHLWLIQIKFKICLPLIRNLI